MTSPIKNRIDTELLIDKRTALYIKKVFVKIGAREMRIKLWVPKNYNSSK